MSDQLPTPPKPTFTIKSQFLIWLLPIILPLIRKYSARLITRVVSFVLVAVGGFLTKMGFTDDLYAQYGFDLDTEKLLTGIATVIVAIFLFSIESVISWISTKLVPPPKAVSVKDSNVVLTDGLGNATGLEKTGVILTVEPKLKLPSQTSEL